MKQICYELKNEVLLILEKSCNYLSDVSKISRVLNLSFFFIFRFVLSGGSSVFLGCLRLFSSNLGVGKHESMLVKEEESE